MERALLAGKVKCNGNSVHDQNLQCFTMPWLISYLQRCITWLMALWIQPQPFCIWHNETLRTTKRIARLMNPALKRASSSSVSPTIGTNLPVTTSSTFPPIFPWKHEQDLSGGWDCALLYVNEMQLLLKDIPMLKCFSHQLQTPYFASLLLGASVKKCRMLCERRIRAFTSTKEAIEMSAVLNSDVCNATKSFLSTSKCRLSTAFNHSNPFLLSC